MSAMMFPMAEYVHYLDQEREKQWSSLAFIRGHSFPNCMINNGKKKSHVLLDAYGQPLKDKNGKTIEILSSRIGDKRHLIKCLKAHGINTPLLQLTGVGESAKEWYYDYWIQYYTELEIKLDAPAMTYLEGACNIYVPRHVMWNKHDAYTKDKSVFAGDKDIHRYMLAIMIENDIKEPAIETARAVVNSKLIKFEKYISKIRDIDPITADEMQVEFDVIRENLSDEIPDMISDELSKWSTACLLPEILKSKLRVLKPGSESEDE